MTVAPRPPAAARPPAVPVSTVLTPVERLRVDAAGEGTFYAMHRESLDDVLRDLRAHRADAVLVSVARCAEGDGARLARLVREFPRVTAVALLSQAPAATPRAVLALGRSGVSTLVDAREPAGWRELRQVLAGGPRTDFAQLAVAHVLADLGEATADCTRFFEILFGRAATLRTVRPIAHALAVPPATLLSRFFRAGLPSPRRYLALARLVLAARLLEQPGVSVAAASNELDYSSPQSFGRHVRTLLGLTAVQFRRRYDGEGMLRRFRDELVLPYAERLRRFSPVDVRPAWLAAGAVSRGPSAGTSPPPPAAAPRAPRAAGSSA